MPRPATAVSRLRTRPSSCRTPAGRCPTRPCGTPSTACCDRPCRESPRGRVRPRLHDLRHTFACRRLLAWYRDGTDIDRAIDQLSAYLGHAKVTDTYWYLTGVPELLALAGQRFEQFAAPDAGRCPMTPTFDILVQDFFCRRLIEQQGVSPRTVEAYRDTFRLLLAYLPQRLASQSRRSPGRSRCPGHPGIPGPSGGQPRQWPAHPQRPTGGRALVRAIRRVARPDRLAAGPSGAGHPGETLHQAAARLPDPRGDAGDPGRPGGPTWTGQRDRVLFAVMYNTGARVSEVIGLRRGDLAGAEARSVRIRGKGRKDRVVPLWKQTAATLTRWSKRLGPGRSVPLFPNARGQPLSRSGVEDRLALAVAKATGVMPEPPRQARLTPHDPPHDGDAPAAGRGRSDGHRTVAGAREPRDDAPVRRGRPEDEGGGADEDEGNPAQTGTFQPKGKLLEFLDNL